MANDVYNNKSGSSLQDAYARLNEAIKQRNASLNGQQYDTTNGVALNTTPVGVNGQQQAQAQGSDANAIWRTIGTIDEALRNVGRGFLKLGEGVVDAHLAIGGIFDKDWAENVIKYDAVNAMMEWEAENASLNALYKQKTGSNLYDESWLNDANNKVQNIVQGVEQGIGNALGFMALSQVPYAGIGLTWSGSGGMVLEEQFNDPNYNGNYYGAWGGAFLQGGVETGLEYLLGWSPKKTGVSAKTFKTILKDLGKDFAEEGLEEVASDLINPLFEGMYTDKTLAESYDDVTIESLGETFLVGGLTGALMSGAGEVSSTIYLSPEGQKIAYEINENNEYYKQAYENFKNNPNEQEAYDNFIKVRDEVATNLKALGERVGKLASKYQNRLGTTTIINGQKVQLPMTQEVLNEQADITSQANPVVMAVKETIDLMNNSNIKGIDNMKVEFVTEGSEAYKKAFKTDAKGINGAYDKNTNTFYLNTNSAKAFKFVTGHEITHLMEENNAYEDVYDEILASLEQSGEYDKLYEKTSKLYEDQIKGMTEEQAREYINQEIVADYFGENFKNFSEIQKLFKKQSTWEKFKDLIKSVRKSNRSSKAKEYYQRFLKEAVNTKIEEKEQPTKSVAYSKSGKVFKLPEWYKEKLRKGIRLKDSEFVTLDIKKLIEDNSLMTGSTTSLRNDVWGGKETDYTFDENKIQDWWYAPIIVENKDGKYKIQDGRHRVIALYNAGYSKIEVVMYEPRTRFSKSIDSEGNNLSEQQARFFKDSKVVDENGNLLVVYHGTTWEFYTFEKEKASPEGDMGKGFYFTNNEEDATLNYSNDSGADLKNKIESLADRIEYTDGVDREEAYNRANDLLYGGQEQVLEVYLDIKNPVYPNTILLSYEDYYSNYDNYNREDFESDEEWDYQIQEDFYDDMQNVKYKVDEILDLDEYNFEQLEELFDNLLAQYEGFTLEELKKQINKYEFSNEQGDYINNEVARAIVEALGYDGIIDSNVSKKFKGMHLNSDTTHYIVFNSNQIKLTSNKTPTKNNDIRFSKALDSEGNDLSKLQSRFFKDSVIRDENGNLMVMYHSSNSKFTVFDLGFVNLNDGKLQGFWFTNNKKQKYSYGNNSISAYINIKNPINRDKITLSNSQIIKLAEARGFKNALTSDEKVIRFIKNAELESDYEIIHYFSPSSNTQAFKEYISSVNNITGYDGYILDNYDKDSLYAIAFFPNQIKTIENKTPTKNLDIRFSKADYKGGNQIFDETDTGMSFYDDLLPTSKMRDYYIREKNLKGTIVKMTPQQYYERCLNEIFRVKGSIATLEELKENRRNWAFSDYKTIDEYWDRMNKVITEKKKLFDMPVLNLAEVSQEGLHRMMLAGDMFGWDTPQKVLVVKWADKQRHTREVERKRKQRLKDYLERALRPFEIHKEWEFDSIEEFVDEAQSRIRSVTYEDTARLTFEWKNEKKVKGVYKFDSVKISYQDVSKTINKPNINWKKNQELIEEEIEQEMLDEWLDDLELEDILMFEDDGIKFSMSGGSTTSSNAPAMFVDSTNYTKLDDIELISLLSKDMLNRLQKENITFTANGRKVIVALRTIAKQTYKDSAGFKREVKALVRQWFESIRVNNQELHTFFDMDKNSTEFKDYVTEMINQTTNDFLKNVSNDIKEREKIINTMISTTIKSFSNQIKSLKELSTRSRKATITISNLKYWAKTAIDGDAIYAKHKLEGVFQASAKTIADLQFSPTTAKVDKSYGAVIQNLKKFYDDSRTTEFKNKEQAVQDYIDEAFKYFEQRYNANGQQFKPLETLDTINDTNYPLLEGKTEVEVYADVLREMRRIINASTKITYAELNGQQVVARDVAREELDRQTNIDRKVARNIFTKGANSYMLSLVDTKTYMTIMAHADNESLMMKIYQELFKGQKETYRIQRELFKGLDKFLDDKNNKKLVNRLNKKKYNVKFKGVELSLNEAISLYMLMGTDNAPSHLIGDGVELETKDVGKVRRILGKDFLSFATEQTQKELAMIKSIKNTSIRKGQQLTQEQLDYLQRQFGVNKKSHADLDGRLSELYEETLKIARSEVKKLIGNEYNEFISVLEKLYKDAGVYYAEGSEKILGLSYAPKDYYYPTKNVKSALKDTDALTSFVNNSLNPSFTKKVKGGSNALFVGGVLETTRGFVNTLSKYCGVTVAVKNVNKFLNAEVKMANGEKYTIADYLSKNVDLKFTDKMNDLFNAMQGIEVKQNSPVDKALRKFRSFASKSALGANLKSTIVQFSSYPKAYMYLDPTNLSKAFKGKKARAKDGLENFEYAMKESAFIANRYRDGNIYNIESVGAFKEVDKFTDWLMKPMEFTDKLVLERIWYACQYECMDSNGKVDFKKAIALFEQVVSDTQAQYDALGNGSITRINNEIMKGALMYSSENRKTLSRIVEAIYMVAVTDKNSPEHKKAVKFLGRVSASFIAQSAFVMAVSILLKALKGDYDDEEAEEIVVGILKDEVATNFVGMFPIIKDIYSVLVQGYDYKVSGVAQAVDLLNAFKDLPTLFDVEASDGERRSAFLQSVTTIAQFFGIPVKNLINDVLYPLGFVDKHFDTNMVMKMKNFFYNTSNSSLNTYLKTYAKRGKEEQVAGTIQMKFKNYISGDIDDVSAKELARLYMNGSLESFPTQLSSSVYVDGVEYTLNKAQKSHAKEIYAIANELLLELIKSSVYATLSDEEKAYAISKLYGTYYELIKQMVVSDYKGTKLSQVANYVDVTKYASILAKIGGMKATTKQTRKVVVQNYINKQRMSSSEKYLLYYLAGYSLDDEKKKLVQNYLKTKGMSYRQAKEFVQPAQNNEKEDK